MAFNVSQVTDRIGDLVPAAVVGAGNAYAQQSVLGAATAGAPTSTRVIYDAALALLGPALIRGEWGKVIGVAGGIGLGEDALGFAQSKGYLGRIGGTAHMARTASVRARLVQPLPTMGQAGTTFQYSNPAAETVA